MQIYAQMITSAKEVTFSPVSVCLSITQKLLIKFYYDILWNIWT